MPSDRHRTHEARHVPHDAARNARFSIGVVNAAYNGIFSVGLQLVAHHSCAIIEAGERGLADVLSLEFEPAPDATVRRADLLRHDHQPRRPTRAG